MNYRAASLAVRSSACSLAIICLLAGVGDAVEPVEVEVDLSTPGHKVSPRLIGAFFEDINFGADGGLCAELVKNGSLEAPKPLLGWSRLGQGVEIELASEAAMSSANPRYLRLEGGDGASDGGVFNEGFRGMGIRGGGDYRLSFQGRSTAGSAARLRVRVVDEQGQELAGETFTVEGSAWRRHEATLRADTTANKARLELRLVAGKLADLDLISLCPADTWKGRPGGLRRDLVQLLADLKPAFFRFPGGCIVEGSELKYRYQWKTTIGPREERRLIVNRWNTEFAHRPAPDYYQSFNLGFFEYFQLAEDLGSEPLPILNCGMACQFNTSELVPLNELAPYIQDALDLIEFANGSAETTWGAKRAAMGHPEPFGMKLLGVGNEQWGPEYFERYEEFARVLQERHPEIELISTSGPFPSGDLFDYAWPLLRKQQVPIVDEHCYACPDWFLREAHRYDNYDRNGPQAFMGEYAAQSVQIVSPRNRNNLRCAIAEAAFLTGIERNSDVVTMSAYAPLMAHEDGWQWRPNLIWFDNLKSYATPSYYVQQLFSKHRGDITAPVKITDPRPAPPVGGRFGLGSHRSCVEFRKLSVDAENQTVHLGDWETDEGVVRQTSLDSATRVLVGEPVSGDATFTCQARKVSGREGFAIFLRYGDGGSRIEWNIGGWNNKRHGLIDQQAAHSTTPRQVVDAEGTIETGRWYDVKVVVQGERVICSLDGEVVHDVEIPRPQIDRVFAGASTADDGGKAIVKLVNPTDEPTTVRLQLNGLAGGPREAQVIRLSGDPEDENSIDAPQQVSPQASRQRLSGADSTIDLPPHSFTILRTTTKGAQ
ncbi:Extracellular exo-alpha-L-arabinofuranosidase precursor [Posidoniimonas polymericola]|uniref:non-reducing end alpha-L-arabinofuranosidase n=1 Tax=Posidoniimonas polymericola TaxID=2528002 RepID=A0A5C5YL43_9BACT|nr:alpha-L-arabinofuranosidase C-terminal domain-containing protein [Posidoniimonas polymericola]TWT75653.1 Extracellular exo-alpha-L-arabinofuranosidase precursor [Posidoniimonas polymericola]